MHSSTIMYFSHNYLLHYIIRKYALPIWSEHNYIFSHRIIRWVYNYMFRPCILAIVRLYYKLNDQPYNMCVGYSGGTRSRLTVVGGIGYTPTCFGPVYWPSSGCTVNLTSSCTICAWGWRCTCIAFALSFHISRWSLDWHL